MKKTTLVYAIVMVFAVFAAGCSSKSAPAPTANQNNAPAAASYSVAEIAKTETSQVAKFNISRKDAVSVAGLQGNIKFGDYSNMKTDGLTLPERWQFSYSLSEQALASNKALTVILQATKISKSDATDVLAAEIIFYDKSGKVLLEDEAGVMLIGKIDPNGKGFKAVSIGETLAIEPFFWMQANKLAEAASFVLAIDLHTRAPRPQEYLPRGSLGTEGKTGVYKEKASAKGKITVGHKTDPLGKAVKVSLTAAGDVLSGAQLRFNWLDKDGKVVFSDYKSDILQEISQYDRRYLAVENQLISHVFDLTFPQAEGDRIQYYEFSIETKT